MRGFGGAGARKMFDVKIAELSHIECASAANMHSVKQCSRRDNLPQKFRIADFLLANVLQRLFDGIGIELLSHLSQRLRFQMCHESLAARRTSTWP